MGLQLCRYRMKRESFIIRKTVVAQTVCLCRHRHNLIDAATKWQLRLSNYISAIIGGNVLCAVTLSFGA